MTDPNSINYSGQVRSYIESHRRDLGEDNVRISLANLAGMASLNEAEALQLKTIIKERAEKSRRVIQMLGGEI